MHRMLLVIGIFLLFGLALTDEIREKAGTCGRALKKRELCQCSPHNGLDQCQDECQDDGDCYGARKCCTHICKRICLMPVLRPTVPRICVPEQEYDFCPPTRPPSCVYPEPTMVRPPAQHCHGSCICKPGLVLAANRTCIPKTFCPPPPPPPPPICPGFREIFHVCYRQCQPSCWNRNGDGCVVTDCVEGCFCAPGFVRSATGRCINPEFCPPAAIMLPPPVPPKPICPSDQEFDSCRRECEPTCHHKRPRGCYRRCQAGCFCKKPFVRDHYGSCIAIEACVTPVIQQPTCNGENEIYIACAQKCQSTCSNPRAENCNTRCLSGCFCKDGYVRDDTTSVCIQFEQCPAPAPPSPPPPPVQPICESELEIYIPCHRGCQKTCENPSGEGCGVDCIRGCFCQPGLVRSPFGHCIHPSQCPNPYVCPSFEHYEHCIPPVPSYCGYPPLYPPISINITGNEIPTPGPEDFIGQPDPRACIGGCTCDEGFIRNRTDGLCVPFDHCRSQYPRSSCGQFEDPAPCGGMCARECVYGWSQYGCPPMCRRRCCRRRRVR